MTSGVTEVAFRRAFGRILSLPRWANSRFPHRLRRTPVPPRLAAVRSAPANRILLPRPDANITWNGGTRSANSCIVFAHPLPHSRPLPPAGQGFHNDQGSLLPVPALRCGRVDLRIDLDPLPRPVRGTRCVRPNHRAGDLPGRHVAGRLPDQSLVRAAQGTPLWLRRSRVRHRYYRTLLPRHLWLRNRSRLPVGLSLARRILDVDRGQVEHRRTADPAAVGAPGNDLSPDVCRRAPPAQPQARPDAVTAVLLEQPGRGGGRSGGGVLSGAAVGIAGNTAVRGHAQSGGGGGYDRCHRGGAAGRVGGRAGRGCSKNVGRSARYRANQRAPARAAVHRTGYRAGLLSL